MGYIWFSDSFYILSLKINLTGMVSFRMLPSCLISFYAGMLLLNTEKGLKKILVDRRNFISDFEMH